MENLDKKLTIIKYGSNTLVTKDIYDNLSIDHNNFHNHGIIINNHNNPIMIVSSGAVAFGKTVNQFTEVEDEVIRKRMLAASGNPMLSMAWKNAISHKIILQGLVTHKDMKDCKSSLKEIIDNTYNKNNDNIILINDNDFLSDEELKAHRDGKELGDNDKLTSLLANLSREIFAELDIIINTSTNGVLDADKQTIKTLNTDQLSDEYIQQLCQNIKSPDGTGGMDSKLKTFRDLVEQDDKINIYIINGKDPKQLKDTLDGNHSRTKISKS